MKVHVRVWDGRVFTMQDPRTYKLDPLTGLWFGDRDVRVPGATYTHIPYLRVKQVFEHAAEVGSVVLYCEEVERSTT